MGVGGGEAQDMELTRHRLVLLPLRQKVWPWRETRAEAVEDAIRSGYAERDEHDPKRIWWHPLVEIEEDDGR